MTGRRAAPFLAGLVVLGISVASASTLTLTAPPKLATAGESSLSVSTPSTSTCTLAPSNNARVEQASPNSSFSGNYALYVRTHANDNQRSYVDFDTTTGLCKETAQTIPAGSGIVSANLSVYLYSNAADNRTINVYRATSSWVADGTLTWNNQPTVNAGATAGVNVSTTTGYKTWDVAADVRAFFAGTATDYGWSMRDSSESSASEYHGNFCSDRNGSLGYCQNGTNDDPYLVVTYQPPADTCTLHPSADVWVDESQGGYNLNDAFWVLLVYFDVDDLRVGSSDNNQNWSANERILTKFDLTSNCDETGQALPSGAIPVSASLQLYEFDANSNSARTYDIYRITSSWTETGVLWGSQPTYAGAATSNSVLGATLNTWKSWDVTNDMASLLDGTNTNYGWMIRDRTENSTSNVWGEFCRREGRSANGGRPSCGTSGTGDQRPRLVITFKRPYTRTCTLSLSQDSYVNSASTGTNYGSNATFLVQSFSTGPANMRAFAQADLASNCAETGSPLPSGANVTAATLSTYLSTAPTASRTYNAYRVTAAWTEGAVTYSNAPAVAGGATSSTTTGTTNGVWLSFNVKSDVAAFLSSTYTNYGWRISDNSESSGTIRTGTFCSREGACGGNNPKLVVTYYL